MHFSRIFSCIGLFGGLIASVAGVAVPGTLCLRKYGPFTIAAKDVSNTAQQFHTYSPRTISPLPFDEGISQNRFLFLFDEHYYDANLQYPNVHKIHDRVYSWDDTRNILIAGSPSLTLKSYNDAKSVLFNQVRKSQNPYAGALVDLLESSWDVLDRIVLYVKAGDGTSPRTHTIFLNQLQNLEPKKNVDKVFVASAGNRVRWSLLTAVHSSTYDPVTKTQSPADWNIVATDLYDGKDTSINEHLPTAYNVWDLVGVRTGRFAVLLRRDSDGKVFVRWYQAGGLAVTPGQTYIDQHIDGATSGRLLAIKDERYLLLSYKLGGVAYAKIIDIDTGYGLNTIGLPYEGNLQSFGEGFLLLSGANSKNQVHSTYYGADGVLKGRQDLQAGPYTSFGGRSLVRYVDTPDRIQAFVYAPTC